MTIREIRFEWALEGKRPGGHDDYELLSWSDGRLGPEVFEEIRSRYATGVSADLPQVTIAVAATKEREQVSRHIVLAIQEWSGHRDVTNRKIAYTRWFYVPYEELAAHRVSYEALYLALAGLPATPSPPLAVPVPEFDPTALDPGPDARCAAALLLTGRPVCVVGADGVPVIERLRFLDTVAALLPYGMRARLTAATWTSSTARHRIRLSFARHAPEDAYEVRWGYGTEITRQDGTAKVCLDLLTRSEVRLADMLRGLAGLTDPLSFGPADRPVAVRLLEHSGYPEVLSATDVRREPERSGPEGQRAGSSGGEAGSATGHGRALPGSGEPGFRGHEPVSAGRGGDTPMAGAAAPTRSLRKRRPTVPGRSLWRRLGRGSGDASAVLPPGTAPGTPSNPSNPSSPTTPPITHTTTGTTATTPYRRTPAEGPVAGTMPPSMQAALGGLEQADRGKRSQLRLGSQAKLTVTVAFATLAITLIGVGTVALLRSPGGDPRAGAETAGTEPGTIVVLAPARREDAFATNVVAEVVRRAGYRFDIRYPPAGAPTGEPAVVLVDDPGPDSALPGELQVRPANPLTAQGFSEAATITVPGRDVVVYDIDQIRPEQLRAAFEHPGKEVGVSLPDSSREGLEQVLKQRYPWLRLETVPASDPLRALRSRTVQAAIVPRDIARDSGYQRLDAFGGLLNRSLLVLCNQAGGCAVRDALAKVARSIDPVGLASAEFDSPGTAAARLVDSALPPSEAAPRPGEGESDRGQDSSWFALGLIGAGGVVGFLALLIGIRVPSRIRPRR